MNVLIISYYLTYPCNNGASVALFGTLEYLSEFCSVSLLLPENHTISDANLQKLKLQFPNVKFYSIESVNSGLDKYKSFRYFPLSNFAKNIITSRFRFLSKIKSSLFRKKAPSVSIYNEFTPESRFFLHSNGSIERILQIIENDKIDVVQLEHFHNINLVTIIPENIKKVFLCHESLLGRIRSFANLYRTESHSSNYVFNVNKKIISAFLNDFDAVLGFSELDTLDLKEASISINRKSEFRTIPFPIFDYEFKDIDRQTFQMPDKLVFVGGESHFPNKDAVEWFIEEMGEEVLSRFGLRLNVIGQWSKRTVEKYKNHPSKVNFVGYVDDIYEVAKNSISIAPIRMGGGLKTKIMLAMAHGTPVISTDFALDGIDCENLESVLVANGRDSFCWAIEYILQDLDRTFLICQNAQARIKKSYSQAVVSKQLYNLYKSLLMTELCQTNKI